MLADASSTACGAQSLRTTAPSLLGLSASPTRPAATCTAAALSAAKRPVHPMLPADPKRRKAEEADPSAMPAAKARSGGRTQLAASIVTRSPKARSSVGCSTAAATKESVNPRRPPAGEIEALRVAPAEMPQVWSSTRTGDRGATRCESMAADGTSGTEEQAQSASTTAETMPIDKQATNNNRQRIHTGSY